MAKPLKRALPPHKERVYVKVNSDFDATGYIQPRSITWEDGRTFMIEAVKDYRPACFYRQGTEGACYTVSIRGKKSIDPVERCIYFWPITGALPESGFWLTTCWRWRVS